MREKAAHYGTLRETDPNSIGMAYEEKDHNLNGRNSYGQYEEETTTASAMNVAKTYSTDSRSSWKKLALRAKENALLLALIASLILGVVLGCMLRLLPATPLTEEQQVYLQFPGEILMNMLKLLILPLIVSSLISGMTTLDKAASGRMIVRAVCYYLGTMMLAVILGIILVVTIRPGNRTGASTEDADHDDTDLRRVTAGDTFLDLIRQMFPDNLIQACFSKKITMLTPVDADKDNETHAGGDYKRKLVHEDGINMLGLVVFSLALGAAINHMGEAGRPLKLFVEALANATLLIVNAVIWYSPFGILFLVAAQIVGLDDAGKSLEQLGLYMVTVMLGLVLHGFVVLPLIFFIFVRKNPYRFMTGVLQAMMTALGTSSSAATLPVTMRNLEENNHIDPRVISFVIPVGATINMDGTALYEAVATIFIGQMNGLDLSMGKVITICITATAAAIGAAGVPQAGLVTMVIVLESVGFPTSGIALVLAVDWMLDRFRTVVNVLGDAYGAGLVDHLSKKNWAESAGESDRIPLTPEELIKAGSEPYHVVKPVANGEAHSADTDTHQTSFYQR